jgi:aminopeptidase N
MDLYFDRHDGEAATIEDFLRAFADATGVDMSPFMRWYEQAGTPELTATVQQNLARQTVNITFEQTLPPSPGQPSKEPQITPVRFGLVAGDGRDVRPVDVQGAAVREDVLILDGARHEVVFTGIAEPVVASLLRGFSAPVKLSVNLSVDDQLFLLAHDSDPFNRWQAAQTTATRLLVSRAGKSQGRPATSEEWDRYIDALGRIAGDDSLDPAFRALVLTPPSEADIAREIGVDVDPDAIALARDALRHAIGTTLADVLSQVYERTAITGPYRPDAASAGRRALRNIALDHLAVAGRYADVQRVSAQFESADNMTDRFAALQTAVTLGLPSARTLLDQFDARYATNALVMDKWFSVQAMAPLTGTLDRVRALTEHPAFSMANPNRVRSLIGAFATGNQTQFNRADGAGFAFVAGIVTSLDARNPQVAARLLSAFRSWRALEPRRRMLAETELRTLAARDGLSPDVSDIVQRCLQ